MIAYLPVLRMVWRDALRAKGRTALVMCMIGLPVAAVVAFVTLLQTSQWSPRESLPYELGAADARLTQASHAPIAQDPMERERMYPGDAMPLEKNWTTAEIGRRVAALYGPRARVLPLNWGKSVALKTPRGYREGMGIELDLRDPMARGIYTITEGRTPAAPDEIALSATLAGREYPVGSTAQIDLAGTIKRVVGHVRVPRSPGEDVALALPGALFATGDMAPEPEWLVSAGRPVTWGDVAKFNKDGILVLSRAVVEHPPAGAPSREAEMGDPLTRMTIIVTAVAMIVLEIVLLAGPAFAVGIRRQRHLLALVALAGGDSGHLRAVVLACGLVLGGVAALAGGTLGIGAAAVTNLVAEATTDTVQGTFEVPWSKVVLTMMLGWGSGVLAAYTPARQAARMDVVAALSGRREQVRAHRGWPIGGAAVALAGMFLILVEIWGRMLGEFGPALGAVAIIGGLVVTTPWLVGAAGRVADRLPVPLRLAVRDSTRNRSRSAPAVAAIMAAVAGVTTLAITFTSDLSQERRDYLPRLPVG